MHVAVIGATGMAGSRVVNELLSRGYKVTAIARKAPEGDDRPGLTWCSLDAASPDALGRALAGHDAVVSAIKFKDVEPRTLVDGIRRSGVKRYIIVGGAASLILPSGSREIDGPGFPEHVKPEARLGIAFLDYLKADVADLDWTFFSPSRIFVPGQRTGTWRTGKDDLLLGPDNQSRISVEDYSAALVDELEKNAHVQERFTVGY